MQSAESTWSVCGTDLAHSKGQGTPEGEDQLVDATAEKDQLHHLAQVVVKEGVLHSHNWQGRVELARIGQPWTERLPG